MYRLKVMVRRFRSAVLGRIAWSRERNGPVSPDPTDMFPTIPAAMGAHQAADESSSPPAIASVIAKKIRVRRRPNRSATKLVTNV